MSARAITTIALVQAAIVFLGFLTLGSALKLQGYPDGPSSWNPVSVALRQHGLLLLLVPLLWTVLAVYAEHKGSRILSENVARVLGIIAAAALLSLFFYAVLFTHGLEAAHIILRHPNTP